jgi:hypothetical protein
MVHNELPESIVPHRTNLPFPICDPATLVLAPEAIEDPKRLTGESSGKPCISHSKLTCDATPRRSADALLPELRARAAEVEQRGMVPEDIIRPLTAAGVFRALQPRQWGGLELDLAAYYDGMIRLASACASTGWVASVVGVHPWHAALFAPEAQREMWSDDPDAMVKRLRGWRHPQYSTQRRTGSNGHAGRDPTTRASDATNRIEACRRGGVLPRRN